jgi:glutathione synthase/RimK-type ligase-like ATP-grasp enzyme
MLLNLQLFRKACQKLDIPYETFHSSQSLMRIKLDKYYYFVNNGTPFNSEAINELFKDKEYTYLLLKDKINMPRCLGFLSPFCPEEYKQYLVYQNLAEITAEVTKNFALPVIVKKNRGLGGNNVFLAKTVEDIRGAFSEIFDVNSKKVDYVALAQEYIDIIHEYRVIVFHNEILLVYEKDKSQAKFTGNLSPLHWEGAIALHITDEILIREIKDFIEPIFSEMMINYAGFDIARDGDGKLWLIEINGTPGYKIFIRDNGEDIIVTMFQTILSRFRDLQKVC